MPCLGWWLFAVVCHFTLALPNTHTHLPPFLAGPGGGSNQLPVAAALQGQPDLGNSQQNLPPLQQGPGNPQGLPPLYRDQGPGNPQIILPQQLQGGQVILPLQQPPQQPQPQQQQQQQPPPPPPPTNEQIRDQQLVDDQNRQQQQRRHQQPTQGVQVSGAQSYVSQPNPQRFPSGVPNIINPAQSPPPAITGALVASSQRRVQKTDVQCLKSHMLVTVRFSAPFNGYVYPHNQFSKCLLFRGDNALEAVLTLRHGTCGDQENRITYRGKSFLDPVIEHRLMVQWEREIVSEDDSSVIVRCDRPDDYNKTVEWKLGTQEIAATLERAQHPGENESSTDIPDFDFGNWTSAINDAEGGIGNFSAVLAVNESDIGLREGKLNNNEYSLGKLTDKVGENEENKSFAIAVNGTDSENYNKTGKYNEIYEEKHASIAINNLVLKIGTLTISSDYTEYEIKNYTALVNNSTLEIETLLVFVSDFGPFMHNITSIVNDTISKIGNFSLAINVAALKVSSVAAANHTKYEMGDF